MPTDRQIEAAAVVLARNGCDKAHASELARYCLIAAEKAAPLTISNGTPLDMFDDWPADYQEQFWARYPHKRTKATAMKSLEKIHKSHKVRWLELMGGLARYIEYVNGQDHLNWMHPATWLNGESWLDEFAPKCDNHSTGRNGFAAMAREGVL